MTDGTRLHRLRTTLDSLPDRFPRLGSRVAIDSRSLAAFRVLAATIVLVDLLLRARNFHFFYTDRGAVPVELATALAPGRFSLYFASGHPVWTGALFLCTAVAALALLVGWRTRAAAIATFLLVVSLDHRNTLATSYADILFRHLLFFSLFVPLSERWSVDAHRRDREPRASVVSLATALVLLQVVLMYVATGELKLGSEAWTTGQALHVILSHDSITFLLGDVVGTLPAGLLNYAGLAWVYMMLASPLLLAVLGRARAAFALAFVGVHSLLGVTVRIGEFSPIAIAGLTLFLPAVFWADGERLAERAGLPIDGVRDRLRTAGERLNHALPAGSAPTALRTRLQSVERPSVARVRSTASTGWSVLLVLVLVIWGVDMVVAVAESSGHIGPAEARGPIDTAKTSFGVEQPNWSIFAPNPSETDEWLVVAVETADDRRLDLHNERRLSFRRPGERLDRQWDTYRERFYWEKLQYRAVGGAYRNYLCRGGAPNAEDVEHVSVYYVSELINTSRPATLDRPETRSRSVNLLYSGTCGGGPHEVVRPRRGVTGLWK